MISVLTANGYWNAVSYVINVSFHNYSFLWAYKLLGFIGAFLSFLFPPLSHLPPSYAPTDLLDTPPLACQSRPHQPARHAPTGLPDTPLPSLLLPCHMYLFTLFHSNWCQKHFLKNENIQACIYTNQSTNQQLYSLPPKQKGTREEYGSGVSPYSVLGS